MRRAIPALPLQWKLTALVLAVLLFAGLVTAYFASQALTRQKESLAGDRVLGVGRLLAERPEVREAFSLENPAEVLQPLTQRWLEQTGLDLIVVFNMDTIRYSHPNPDLVGQHFTGGDEGPSLEGEEYVSMATGISGPSLRAFVPVYDDDGKQVGVVVAGVWMSHLTQQVRDSLLELAGFALFGLGVGALGAAAVAYNIKTSIFGLEPSQIASILEERVAILQSIREGVIAVDKKSRITLLNTEAERLTGVGQEAIGRPVVEALPNSRLPEIVETGRPEFDQEQVLQGRVILTNRVPIVVDGKVVGAVATFRDMSEMRELAAELTGVTQLANALRAQAHEFINRLHTVSGLLQLARYDDAIEYIATATRTHEEMVGFVTRRIREPALAGLVLGKISAANERGITLNLDPDSDVPVHDHRSRRADLTTVVGNLLENAFDAVSTLPEDRRNVWLSLYADEQEMLIEVEDTGLGIEEENRQRIFERGFTTKPGSKGIGLSLVAHEVSRLGGGIEVESQVGVGTRFTIHLPRGGGQRPEPGTERQAPLVSSGRGSEGGSSPGTQRAIHGIRG
ncbi:MAG: DcuS/MalK family sensor histidine kinase [Sphingomonadaceae bacterium]